MYPQEEVEMSGRNAERKTHISMDQDLHKGLRIRCAGLDTTIEGHVVELLDCEMSAAAPRRSAKSHASPGRR